MTGRGGRPRNADVAPRVLAAARTLLAERGLAGITGDAIAAAAGVGKASIYRRWPSLDELLVDVVRDLGVRTVDHGEGPGTAHDDVTRLLHAATSGRDAAAEVAILSSLAYTLPLQVAYLAGPTTRLNQAAHLVLHRAQDRGEPSWWSTDPVLAGVRLLQHQALVDGEQPTLLEAAEVAEDVVLPALGYAPAVPA